MKVKNVLLSGLSFVLVAAVAIGGTVAYLTSTDSDVNVMTHGQVKITQHEYERVLNADGSYEMVTSEKYGEGYKLQEFTQAKPLYPATGKITGWGTKVPFDQIEGASGAQAVFAGLNNVQDKFVLVENTGKSDAYVRTLIALEYGSNIKDIIGISTGDFWTWNEIGIIEVDGNNYYMYEAIYNGSDSRHQGGVLPAGEYTYNSLAQVYLSSEATNDDVDALDGNNNGTYDILIFSQAVQTAGFDTAENALDAAFGDTTTTNHPWTDGVVIPAVVSSSDELVAAIAEGKDVILSKDITDFDADSTVTVAADKDVTFNLNGHKITATAEGTGNREVFLVKGNMTVKNGKIELVATQNQGWNAMATVFDVTAGGTLNMEGVELNVSGTDMTFGVHLNNWGEVNLNMNNSTINANYCAVRVFNSGYDMNNVTITNSTLHGDNRAFWVHNYIGDLDSAQHSDEAIKARLNIDLINGTNTITNGTTENPKNNPIRYGFGDQAIYYDANGNDVTIR